MGISVFPTASTTPASDNYVLVSTVTPTNGATTVSITGLSSYRKLLVRVIDPTISANGNIYLTINSDSGNNYAYQALGTTTSAITTPSNAIDATFIRFQTTTSSGSLRQILTIDNANTTGAKAIGGFGLSTNASTTIYYTSFEGVYFGTSVVSSIQLTVGGITFTGGGSISVYGVAA